MSSEQNETPANRWEAPLLITGCPRSGTSALAHLLSTHEQICIFNEYSLYWPPVLEKSVWHRIEGMGVDNPPPEKIANNASVFRRQYCEELPQPVSDRSVRDWLFGKTKTPLAVYGDKMPYLYLDNMKEVAKRFPRVKFLLTLRDGRAVVASQIRQYRLALERGVEPMRWMFATVSEAESIWLRSAKKWLEIRQSPPAPCLEVRYEQATQAPAEIAKQICDFAGIEFRESHFTEFIAAYEPVHADAWREEIPDIDRQLSPEFRNALKQLGYN
jgi:hypothetical protein